MLSSGLQHRRRHMQEEKPAQQHLSHRKVVRRAKLRSDWVRAHVTEVSRAQIFRRAVVPIGCLFRLSGLNMNSLVHASM